MAYNQKKGASLVEVLVSIALIMVMVFIYITYANLIKLNKKDTDLSLALFLANQEIEILKGLPYSELTNRENSEFIGDVDLSILNQAEGYITINDYMQDPNIKQVDIILSWIDRTETKDVNLSTLISYYGLSQE